MRILLTLLLLLGQIPFPPGRPSVHPFPGGSGAAPQTILRFELTLPEEGAPPAVGYNVSVYAGAPVDQNAFPRGNWMTLVPDYNALSDANGVVEFTDVVPGNYWFVTFNFNGYASHGVADNTVGRVVTVLPNVTNTEIVNMTQWTDEARTVYTSTACANGLQANLNAQGEFVFSATDFMMNMPAGDATPLVTRSNSDWLTFGPTITATCSDLPFILVDVSGRSSNGIWGDYCTTWAMLDDPLSACGF
jgi:hypothetical protein